MDERQDGEPSGTGPAGPWYVPVRPGPGGCAVIRLFRTPVGVRTAVGFTTVARLRATLGAGQDWIELAEAALRAQVAPLGIAALTLDPRLTAPRVGAPGRRPPRQRRRAAPALAARR